MFRSAYSSSPPTATPDAIRETAAGWDASTAPAWARPLLAANPKLRGEIAVFRAAHDVAEPDTRLTGPDQYAVRDRKIQLILEDAANREIGRTAPDTTRFNALVDEVDPRVRRDPYWTQLAAHLAKVARTDIDLRQLVADAQAFGDNQRTECGSEANNGETVKIELTVDPSGLVVSATCHAADRDTYLCTCMERKLRGKQLSPFVGAALKFSVDFEF